MTTDTYFVGLELHNKLTAGPAPWTDTRVPAQVFHVCRAVFGTNSQEDDQRVYRTLQAALMTLKTDAKPVNVASVATIKRDPWGEPKLSWLLEGGSYEAAPDFGEAVLLIADAPITDDCGHGEVYRVATA